MLPPSTAVCDECDCPLPTLSRLVQCRTGGIPLDIRISGSDVNKPSTSGSGTDHQCQLPTVDRSLTQTGSVAVTGRKIYIRRRAELEMEDTPAADSLR